MIDSKSEINTIYLTFVKELGLFIRPTDVRAQKIDGTTLNTYGMVVTVFSITDKANRVRFFEKSFLVANVSLKVVLGMPFLILSSANVNFLDRELRWRIYTIEKALPTTRHVNLLGKKEFAAAAFDPEYETFVIYIIFLNLVPEIYLDREAQITSLFIKEIKIPDKYSDFTNVF